MIVLPKGASGFRVQRSFQCDGPDGRSAAETAAGKAGPSQGRSTFLKTAVSKNLDLIGTVEAGARRVEKVQADIRHAMGPPRSGPPPLSGVSGS